MNEVAEHLNENLKALSKEMRRVAILLDAAGYQHKYIEMSGAADMADEWAEGIMQDADDGILNLPLQSATATRGGGDN